MDQQAMTVLGPVPCDDLGVTLPHEHVLVDWSSLFTEPETATAKALYNSPLTMQNLAQVKWDPLACKDNYSLDNIPLSVNELGEFRRSGGGTVVDVTNWLCGRDPLGLQRISRQTGLHIIMGCGYYIAAAHPDDMESLTIDEISSRIVDEIQNGVGVTGVRPGIIGEIGTSSPITANEEKSLRAACRAHKRTGALITVHLDPWNKEGNHVLDIVESEDVHPGRVILDHLSATLDDLDYHRQLADRGAYLEYDFFGFDHALIEAGKWVYSDWESVRAVIELVNNGLINQLLLSHDVGVKLRLKEYGGFGYAHLLEHIAPLFIQYGLDHDQVNQMVTANPQRVLAFGTEPPNLHNP